MMLAALIGLEVYPAIIGTPGRLDRYSDEVVTSEPVIQAPTQSVAQPVATVAATPGVPVTPGVGQPPRASRQPAVPYYLVPKDQTTSFVVRMALVRAIFERHGRAYDYREHTIEELHRILDELDASAVLAPPAPELALPEG